MKSEQKKNKLVSIAEFLEAYDKELEKMFDGDENAKVYGEDVYICWNGLTVNLGDGATPYNYIIEGIREAQKELEF